MQHLHRQFAVGRILHANGNMASLQDTIDDIKDMAELQEMYDSFFVLSTVVMVVQLLQKM